MKNYYEILEVNRKASQEIIEKAYKVLAKKYHPDLCQGEKRTYAETKIKEINEAYHVLSDEFLREQYDREIEQQEREGNRSMQQSPENRRTDEEETKQYRTTRTNKIGSLGSIIDLTKQLVNDIVRSKEKREEIKAMTKKDIFAILLTIVIVLLLGVVLWMIPFTNAWMRELLFENPLFNWIGNWFA